MIDEEITELIAEAGTDIALTLWPEWAWAVTHLDKDVENRGYDLLKADSRLRRTNGRMFIHAGASIGGPAAGVRDRRAALDGVLHTARAAGWVLDAAGGAYVLRKGERAVPWQPEEITRGALVSVVTVTGSIQGRIISPWQNPAEWANRLADITRLEKPIPCKGLQRIWSVRDQLRKAA